jgi:hypothetical protein
MIDELDLAFDEPAERGRPRHRRGYRGGKKGRRGRSTVAFLMAFVLLAVLGGGVYFGFNRIKGFFTAADYSGSGTGQVTVQIAEDASLTEMGNTLVDSDVVKSTKAFINAAEDNPKGKNIQSGTYLMRRQMSAKAAVALMLDPKSRNGDRVGRCRGLPAAGSHARQAGQRDHEIGHPAPPHHGCPLLRTRQARRIRACHPHDSGGRAVHPRVNRIRRGLVYGMPTSDRH